MCYSRRAWKALAYRGAFWPDQRHNPLEGRRRYPHPGQAESIKDCIGSSVVSQFREHRAMAEQIKRSPDGQARISLATQSRGLPLVDQGDRSFLNAVSDRRGFAVVEGRVTPK